MCLIAAMVYISLISVDLIVPDWSEENQAEADANVAKDIYYIDDDEVHCSDRLRIRPGGRSAVMYISLPTGSALAIH